MQDDIGKKYITSDLLKKVPTPGVDSRITEDVCKDPGKILRIFVCDSIVCQLHLVWYNV